MSQRVGATPVGAHDAASAATAVQQMFDEIAPSYDRLNHVLSAGLDRTMWRRAAGTFSEILRRPDAAVLDLCCGTGDMTAALLELRPVNSAPITGVDFSRKMIEIGRKKLAGQPVNFIEADAMHLPLPDASQDLVVSAFGFRNLADYNAGLREIRRVLKPGGCIGILECSEPKGIIGAGYRIYFHHILPIIGRIVSGSRGAYSYLPMSVERFPAPTVMCGMMRDAGFSDAAWDSYIFGTAGLFRGTAA